MIPNYTEAVYLAGMRYDSEGMTMEETDELIGRLREIGARSMVITSARVDHQDAVSTLIDRDKDNEDKFKGTALFSCPDVNTLNIFRIERLEDEEQEEQDE